MNLRAKARRPLGAIAFAAAVGFFFASASPATAQSSTDNGNHNQPKYSASVHGSC
jgi:hypothetical protein